MFTGTYHPGLNVHARFNGKISCTLKKDTPAGTLSFFDTLDAQSKRQFSLLKDNPAMSNYEIFLRNAVRFPAVIQRGIFIPAHGIPFDHCCTLNTIGIFTPGTNKIEIRLIKPVMALEIITVCYCPATFLKTFMLRGSKRARVSSFDPFALLDRRAREAKPSSSSSPRITCYY
ncbi:predicted protein [Sclerotinia sclerotiorum 1980 UF-70]|uniref:Uncharacterized protein n=1 Tax=Sclerotinia sclerotiorum (strain ATCC 18683 / 1980 / Ss-1) TaxID=665079 RepID=A7E5V9_SCLS1|nr:predicted protein [Sclerotinia sclerotiorum 1980 UF-70]EDN91281.1 predicted protein [Sclerotinia sclerotiorum 1980 UF-70]